MWVTVLVKCGLRRKPTKFPIGNAQEWERKCNYSTEIITQTTKLEKSGLLYLNPTIALRFTSEFQIPEES